LCKCGYLIERLTPETISQTSSPFVVHLGWLDWENRKNQNKTWQPVWSNRAGFEVNNIMNEEEDFNKIQVFNHNLTI